MLKYVYIKLLAHRHPWRELSFSQLAELYSAVSLRNLAQNLVGLFIPVFLYKNGYSLQEVLLFFMITAATSALAAVPIGYLVARIGPKHTLLLSNLVQIAALLLIATIPVYGWPIALPAVVLGLAVKLYYLAYHVDFSKILHPEHGGKELGFMTNLGQLANLLAPLAGGLIALAFGARWTLYCGVVMFALAAIPLFASGEPTASRHKLDFRGLLAKKRWPDYVSFVGYSISFEVAVVLWPLFLAVAVFSTSAYAKIGLVTSVGSVAGLFSAMAIGRLVDKNQGGFLLKASTIAAATCHFLRAVVGSFGSALILNTADLANSNGYNIAYIRGFYDQADSLSGQRIAYISLMETATEIGNLAIYIIGYGFSMFLLPGLALKATFVATAGLTLLMLVQRFPALAPRYRLPLRLLASLRVR